MTKILQSAPVQAALARFLAYYLRFTVRLQGWRIEDDEALRLLTGDAPVIVAFWHETLPSMAILWARAHAAGMTRPGSVLASRHRDGQLIGSIMRHLGMGLVSASSSRGGATGMRELIRILENGAHVGLTPDGPRGPRRGAAPGIAALAGITGTLVLPCAAHTSRAVTLNSWDRMRIPLPFGRGRLVCGAPIAVPRDNWRDAVPAIEAALNDALARASAP